MSERRDPLAEIFSRSLDEMIAVMVEHGMTRLEAIRACIDPRLIPEDVREVLRQKR
jgi:hypothetical protein